jgi:hypothetical protein
MEYRLYTGEEKRQFRETPGVLLEMRKAAEKAMAMFFPFLIKGSASQVAAEEHMKQQMITKLNNPELASQFVPDFAPGCRRITVSRSTYCVEHS